MILSKWNYKTHEYESFESPAKIVMLFQETMNSEVDCANCGKHTTYGICYTSRTIHNHIGLGYPVCESCYEVELES